MAWKLVVLAFVFIAIVGLVSAAEAPANSPKAAPPKRPGKGKTPSPAPISKSPKAPSSGSLPSPSTGDRSSPSPSTGGSFASPPAPDYSDAPESADAPEPDEGEADAPEADAVEILKASFASGAAALAGFLLF